MTIELAQADITKQQVDAIVNAANSHLEHVGGLARAIALAAGTKLAEESFEAPYVPVGEAYATTAGRLPARYVIHAVGPIWRGGRDGEPVLLSSAYRSAVARAAELDCNSIALPAISTGIYGYPVSLAAPLALRAIQAGMREHGVVRIARLCLFSEADYAVFRDAAAAVAIPVIEVDA